MLPADSIQVAPVQSLAVRLFNSVDEIKVEDWQMNGEPYNPFHELSFLEILEEANVENADHNYLLIYEDNQAIATAILSNFTIDLSLFIGQKKWVRWIKKLFPNLFNIRILFCGTPVSIGHNNFHCTQKIEACLKILDAKMIEVAIKNRINCLVIKELSKSILRK